MVASTPQRRFKLSWVLIDELAIGAAPRAERHLEYLEAEGIKAVLSFSSQNEAPLPEQIEHRFQYRRLVLRDHKADQPVEESIEVASANFSPQVINDNVTGEVNLIRNNRNGSATRQRFRLDLSQGASNEKNPPLRDGDTIVVHHSGLAKGSDAIGAVSEPVSGLVNLWALLDLINKY